MRKGSILVVTLVIVIFLSLTVIMMLALYSQLVNNYTMQQKRLLVSNVAKSGAYVLADYYINLLRKDPNLANNLNVDLTASLREFPGQIGYKVRNDGNYITVTCVATLSDQKVSDSYSLKLEEGLSFSAALISATSVEIPNKGTITGDVVVLQGDLELENEATIAGTAVVLQGNLKLENNAKIGGTAVVLQGDLKLDNNAEIGGTAYVKGKIVSLGGGGASKPKIQKDAYAGGSIDRSRIDIGGTAYPNQNPVPFPSQYAYGNLPLPLPPPEKDLPVSSPVVTNNGIVISRSGNYGNITVGNNETLIFDTSNGDLSVYVNNIYMDTKSEIVVKGGNRVKVYFENKIEEIENKNNKQEDKEDKGGGNQVTVTVKDGSQILFYSAGSGGLDFGNGFEVKVDPPDSKGAVFFYAPNAEFKVLNNPTFVGAIVTKKFSSGNKLNMTFVGSEFPINFSTPVLYIYRGWSK